MQTFKKTLITIEIPAGTNLADAENAAICLAVTENATVNFAFNGSEYSFDPVRFRAVIATKKIED